MWRSEDEMLDVVRARARRVTAHRRLVGTALGGAVVLVAATAVGLVRLTGDGPDTGRPLHVAASGGSASSTTSGASVYPDALPFPTTSTTPTGAPDLPTTVAPTTTVTAASPPTAPSMQMTAADEGPSTTSTTSKPAVPTCAPADGKATATVDQPSYLPGQPVHISGVLQNVSGRTCDAPGSSEDRGFDVTNSSGVRVFSMVMHIMDGYCFPGPDPNVDPCAWPPGNTDAQSWCWDQRDDASVQVPVGTYTVRVTWGRPASTSATATVQIVANPSGPTTTVAMTTNCV